MKYKVIAFDARSKVIHEKKFRRLKDAKEYCDYIHIKNNGVFKTKISKRR